ADLRHDNVWWLGRDRQGWQWMGLAIFVFGFVVPFSLLLFRAVKRNVDLLAAISALVLVAQLAFVAYQVFSSLRHSAVTAYALSPLVAAGMCALWFIAFRKLLASAPIVPLCDRNWDYARHLKTLEQEEAAREDDVQSMEAAREAMLPRRAADVTVIDDARI